MLEVRNLTKIYKPKKGVPVVALGGVSLRFPDTGMVFLLGKSGSGKSTLLNLLGGLDRYDGGEIVIKGVSSRDFSQSDFDSYRNTYLGFIFQEYNILDEFSVGANIALAIELQKRKATSEEVNAILREVDLAGYGSRKPNELSGGQKQRVAIARALVKSPEIIMADEPTGALDSTTGRQVFDTLKKLSKDKLVIIVSHDRDFSEQYADRIIELADGKVISDVELENSAEGIAREGLTFTENGEVGISTGYQITEEDRVKINEYIDSLAANNKAKLRVISQNKRFSKTDESQIVLNNEKKYKPIKSRLPMKNAAKMGASSLKHKKIRLITCIALSLVAFALFGVCDTLGSFNLTRNYAQSIVDSEITYAAFVKEKRRLDYYDNNRKPHYSWSTENRNTIFEDDLAYIKSKTGVDTVGVFKDPYSSFNFGAFLSTQRDIPNYYSLYSAGYVTLDKSMIDKFGYTLTGELPKSSGEIAITKYTADSLFSGGKLTPRENMTSDSIITLKDAYDIIGKSIKIGGDAALKIVGVVDTKLDIKRYEILDDNPVSLNTAEMFVYYTRYNELNNLREYSLNTVIFATKADIDTLRTSVDYYEQISNGYLSFGIMQNDSYLNGDASTISKLTSAKSNTSIIWLGEERTALADDEVIVSVTSIVNYIQQRVFSQPDMFPNTYANMKLFDYNYDEKTQQNISGTYDFITLINTAKEEGVLDTYYNVTLQHYNYNYGYDSSTSTNMKIVGCLYGDFYNNGYIKYDNYTSYDLVITVPRYNDMQNQYNSSYGRMILPDWYYETVLDGQEEQAPYAFAVGIMPSGMSSIRKVVAFSTDKTGDYKYTMQNQINRDMEDFEGTFTFLSKIMFWVGFAFCVFAMLLFSNFIATSVSFKKKEIGILRAIGARSMDVFRIFFSEAFIIAAINFILSLTATLIIDYTMNYQLRHRANLLLTLVVPGIRQVLLLAVIAVGTAAIASFLPVYRFAKKRPIDAIRDR